MNYQYIMYMKKQTLLPALLASMLAGAAIGCSNELPQSAPPAPEDGRIAVTATAGIPRGGVTTRVAFNENSSASTLEITWRSDLSRPETFSVLEGTAAVLPSTFAQAEVDAGNAHNATFEGTIKDRSSNFYALYPALPEDKAATPTDITLDMSGQTGDALDESKLYMCAQATYNDGLAFSFVHLTSILKLKLKFPDVAGASTPDMEIEALTRGVGAAGTVTGVQLRGKGVYASAQVDITGTGSGVQLSPVYTDLAPIGVLQLSGSFTAEDNAATVYLHLLPGTLAEAQVIAIKEGKTYTGTLSGTVDVGTMYTAEVAMQQSATFDDAAASGEGEAPALLTTGENTKDNPYLIASPANLRWLVKQLADATDNNPTTGKYYRLTTDVEVTADKWVPIGGGGTNSGFGGSFDGDGHIISGTLQGDAGYFGFFGYCDNGNSEITNLHMAATVTSTSSSGSSYIGSVAGYAYKITGCSNSGSVIGNSHTGTAGGIVGATDFISGCVNTGKVDGGSNIGMCIGGIVGDIVVDCSDCYNSGEVTGQGSGKIGGIVGGQSMSSTLKMEGCTNIGKVGGPSFTFTGGILGLAYSLTLIRCTNHGEVIGGTGVNGRSNTGGIAGNVGSGSSFHLCHNSGTVMAGSSGNNSYTGGLIGYYASTFTITVYDCCTNTGTPDQWIGSNATYEPVQCEEHH